MGKNDYDELMKRWLTNQVTETERVKIEAWLDSIKDNDAEDIEMTDEEAQYLFQKIKSTEDNIREIQSFKPDAIRRKQRARAMLRIAAGLLLVVLTGYGIWTLAGKDAFWNVQRNDITKRTLEDGSIVWLHGKSELNYQQTPSGRFAELTGEALFEVAKDSLRPFIVKYKEVNIRVVGTSFNLKTGDSVELMVFTGKVNLSTTHTNQSIDVTPNERVIYTHTGITKLPFAKEEAKPLLANTEYEMNFVQAEFSQVITRLEKKFDVNIKLTNEEIEKCHINLDITDHSLLSSLQMIESVLNIAYQVNGKQVLISGEGCNVPMP